MTTSRPPSPPHPPRSGKAAPAPNADLRQRILDVAEALLEDEGLAALSMREVARRSGVTHQAPYHHFADRETILASLVARGFELMAQRMRAANDRAKKLGRRAGLQAAGEAYVGFAIDHPGVFRIMFRPELCDATRFPEAMDASRRAYEELARLVRLMHRGEFSEGLATTYWAQVHGLAFLIVDGPIGQQVASVKGRRARMREGVAHFVDFAMAFEPDERKLS
jgi:AcrR family transcriptional regulator